MKYYIQPAVKTHLVSSVLCAGSRLDLEVNPKPDDDGHADGNNRRGFWGNLWDEE